MASLYEISARTIEGRDIRLSEFAGKVILVVNVASKCGFTKQYAGLEALYRQWRDRGLVVLGFPCDQFGHQEPGSDEDIQTFCRLTYDVTFPMFSKVDVNGADAHPLFAALKSDLTGIWGSEGIKWNFTKFLIDRQGRPIRRFAPTDTPEKIAADIEALL